MAELNKILVVSVKKSFWKSPECHIFPHRIYTTVFYGYSQNFVNSAFLFVKTIIAYLYLKPKVLLIGSAIRIVPWLIKLRQKGLLKKTRLIVTNQINFNNHQAQFVDDIIVYSKGDIVNRPANIIHKYHYIPLAIKVEEKITKNNVIPKEKYIFSGGGAGRDFKTLINAAKDLPIKLKIVTFSPEKLNYKGTIPKNCEILWQMPIQEFLNLIAFSSFVVVPLLKYPGSHGQTVVLQALSYGKPVIGSADSSLEEYITNGENGYLVEAENDILLREKIQMLVDDSDLRKKMGKNALEGSKQFIYSAHAKHISNLCYKYI